MFMTYENALALRMRALEDHEGINAVYVASAHAYEWCVVIAPGDASLAPVWIWSPEEYDPELPFAAIGE